MVRISYVSHSTFWIESPGGVTIATDYAGWTGRRGIPRVVTMNKAHETHFTDTPDPAIEHVLRGWNPEGGRNNHNLEVGDVFGGLTVQLFNNQLGGTVVDFFYKVTNGDTAITEVLVDDIFPGDVPGSPIASMVAGEMQTLTRTIELINSVENPVTVSALNGTAVCDNATNVTVHETARVDKGSKGSKGSKRGSKKMKKKKKKGSHKRHKRSKGGTKKGS